MIRPVPRPTHSKVNSMKALLKPFVYPLLLTATIMALTAGSASAAKLDTPWAGSGTGATKVVANGTAADPQFDYDATGNFDGSWTFNATAASDRAVPLKWEYSGLHAWYLVRVKLEKFVQRGGVDVAKETLVDAGPAICCTSPSDGFAYKGDTTFQVKKGDVYGFRLSGGNFDANMILRGSMVLHEVDTTAPAVTPVVTGSQGPERQLRRQRRADLEGPGRRLAHLRHDRLRERRRHRRHHRQDLHLQGHLGRRHHHQEHHDQARRHRPRADRPRLVVKEAGTAAGATVTYETSAKTPSTPPRRRLHARLRHPVRRRHHEGRLHRDRRHRQRRQELRGDRPALGRHAPRHPRPTPAPTPAPKPTTKPSALKKINALLAFRFTINKQSTRLVSLSVKNSPPARPSRSPARATPAPARSRAPASPSAARAAVSLTALFKTYLRGGTRINVSVSSPASSPRSRRS